MDIEFIRERITQLRLQKGVSEYKMSYDLGHSRGYINNISSGKTLPSMTEFLAICEYFGITPIEFFNAGALNPRVNRELLDALERRRSRFDLDERKKITEKIGRSWFKLHHNHPAALFCGAKAALR